MADPNIYRPISLLSKTSSSHGFCRSGLEAAIEGKLRAAHSPASEPHGRLHRGSPWRAVSLRAPNATGQHCMFNSVGASFLIGCIQRRSKMHSFATASHQPSSTW